jgi:hypothetical protein
LQLTARQLSPHSAEKWRKSFGRLVVNM